jgi:hypothetical protein
MAGTSLSLSPLAPGAPAGHSGCQASSALQVLGAMDSITVDATMILRTNISIFNFMKAFIPLLAVPHGIPYRDRWHRLMQWNPTANLYHTSNPTA